MGAHKQEEDPPPPARGRTDLVTMLKRGMAAALVAAATGLTGAFLGFVSNAYLEIWFNPGGPVKATSPSSWSNMAEGFSMNVDLTDPDEYRLFYGINVGNLKTQIFQTEAALRVFKLSSRVLGTSVLEIDEEPLTYQVVGFMGGRHLTLSLRSQRGSKALVIASQASDRAGHVLYYGHIIAEDQKWAGSDEYWVTRCPFVMISRHTAERHYPTAEVARESLDLLRTPCAEFPMPRSVFARASEPFTIGGDRAASAR
jgi:hypothetical protein